MKCLYSCTRIHSPTASSLSGCSNWVEKKAKNRW